MKESESEEFESKESKSKESKTKEIVFSGFRDKDLKRLLEAKHYKV